jgi:hypothetical protein
MAKAIPKRSGKAHKPKPSKAASETARALAKGGNSAAGFGMNQHEQAMHLKKELAACKAKPKKKSPAQKKTSRPKPKAS